MLYSELPKLALSIRQPWAWAILHAGKDIENRDWRTRYRGPVCIHAAKGCTQEEFYSAASCIGWERIPASSPRDFLRGGIIGTAEIIDCVEVSDSPWFVGRFGFVLANARPVDFILVRGALGFFNWREQLSS
ncbi:ASCH domain-containing protein [Fodinicurvata fenggangensis]|uniref:ASCH domain-containing protein n=1 Tax=Fodinicurvata fenggangensis TaxID=1121830 RepID=UPI00047C784C|nr:ASCH domain-containing protein [Fodinicurvata fenggangensis]